MSSFHSLLTTDLETKFWSLSKEYAFRNKSFIGTVWELMSRIKSATKEDVMKVESESFSSERVF